MRCFAILGLLTALGLAVPAEACRSSEAIFSARPNGAGGIATRVHVDQALRPARDGPILAVRATLLEDTRFGRSGDGITIIMPGYPPDNCYYFGLYDPSTVAVDGTLQAYVDLLPTPGPSGAFAAASSHRTDIGRYERLVRGRGAVGWGRARFDAESRR